jgi:hypothetical protein
MVELLPCETDEPPACPTCEDTGNGPVRQGRYIFDAPCPECPRGDQHCEGSDT